MDAVRVVGLVELLKAVADPTRLHMLAILFGAASPVCICDLTATFELSQPTISHHLKILRDTGLVTVSRRGVWAYYAVDPSGLALLRGALAELVPGRLADVG